MLKNRSRVDELGRAFAGSQLQIQIYVNRREEELSQAVLNALPSLASLSPRVHWVSPLESKKFIEYKDAEFLRAVGLVHLSPKLKELWPFRGPNWDALAAVEIDNKWGYIDKTGKIVIKPQFDRVQPFSDGRAKVKVN